MVPFNPWVTPVPEGAPSPMASSYFLLPEKLFPVTWCRAPASLYDPFLFTKPVARYFLTAAASLLCSIGPAHTELELLIPGKYFSEGFALMMLVSSYSQFTSQPHPNNVNCCTKAEISRKWSCPLGSQSLLFSPTEQKLLNTMLTAFSSKLTQEQLI